MPLNDPCKGKIPLVMSIGGKTMHLLRDSAAFQRELKKITEKAEGKRQTSPHEITDEDSHLSKNIPGKKSKPNLKPTREALDNEDVQLCSLKKVIAKGRKVLRYETSDLDDEDDTTKDPQQVVPVRKASHYHASHTSMARPTAPSCVYHSMTPTYVAGSSEEDVSAKPVKCPLHPRPSPYIQKRQRTNDSCPTPQVQSHLPHVQKHQWTNTSQLLQSNQLESIYGMD
jgi:hypothetical protein